LGPVKGAHIQGLLRDQVDGIYCFLTVTCAQVVTFKYTLSLSTFHFFMFCGGGNGEKLTLYGPISYMLVEVQIAVVAQL
jgi:hypothetical protein